MVRNFFSFNGVMLSVADVVAFALEEDKLREFGDRRGS